MKKNNLLCVCMTGLFSALMISGCGVNQASKAEQYLSYYESQTSTLSVNEVTDEYINECFYATSPVPEKIDVSQIDIPYEDWEAEKTYSAPETPIEEMNLSGLTACEVLELYMYDKDNIEFISLDNHSVPDVNELVHMLRNFPKLTQVDMCDTGLSCEQMNAINKAFPDIDIIFNFRVNHWNLRTDRKAFSTYQGNYIVYRWTSDDAMLFRYCKDLVAIDLGHNALSSLEFLKFMPELRILIFADNYGIKDISPIGYCTKLQYVEVFMESFTDISCFANCPDLIDLNLCYTKFTSLEPLYDLQHLERLWMVGCWSCPRDQVAKMQELFPDLKINTAHPGSTDWGWREHERYYGMRYTFANNELAEVFCSDPTNITNINYMTEEQLNPEPEDTTEVTPEATPETTPEVTPEATPEETPKTTSEETPSDGTQETEG